MSNPQYIRTHIYALSKLPCLRSKVVLKTSKGRKRMKNKKRKEKQQEQEQTESSCRAGTFPHMTFEIL